MMIYSLMKRWAHETYSHSNTAEERETFSLCLFRLFELNQLLRDRQERSPIDPSFLVIPYWERELQAAHNSDAVKQVYATCIEQLRAAVTGVTK